MPETTPPTYQPGGPVTAGAVHLESGDEVTRVTAFPAEELVAALNLGRKLTLAEGQQLAEYVGP